MTARTIPRSSKASRHGARTAAGAWFVPLARLLGRSTRFAAEEANHLVRVARDTISYTFQPPASPRRDVRAGPPATALVTELAQLVAQVDSASLERDKRFWGLVRELYSRRPWVPRRPRDLVDTVGVEVKEHGVPSHAANSETTIADGSKTEPNVERMAK